MLTDAMRRKMREGRRATDRLIRGCSASRVRWVEILRTWGAAVLRTYARKMAMGRRLKLRTRRRYRWSERARHCRAPTVRVSAYGNSSERMPQRKSGKGEEPFPLFGGGGLFFST